MWTVGRSRSKSAIPRPPRVISTASARVCLEQLAAGALEDAQILADSDVEQLLDLGFVRRARGHPAKPQQRVARIDQHRTRASSADIRLRAAATTAGATSPLP